MNYIDFILLGVIGVFALVGFVKGALRSITGLLSPMICALAAFGAVFILKFGPDMLGIDIVEMAPFLEEPVNMIMDIFTKTIPDAIVPTLESLPVIGDQAAKIGEYVGLVAYFIGGVIALYVILRVLVYILNAVSMPMRVTTAGFRRLGNLFGFIIGAVKGAAIAVVLLFLVDTLGQVNQVGSFLGDFNTAIAESSIGSKILEVIKDMLGSIQTTIVDLANDYIPA